MSAPAASSHWRALRDGWIVPVARRLDGAVDPSLAFQHAASTGPALLLESGRHHSLTGRYSFIGVAPRLEVQADRSSLTVTHDDGRRERHTDLAPWTAVCRLARQHRAQPAPELPPFTGGFAGYVSYEARHWFERLPQRAADDLGLPWLHWAWWNDVVAVDHVRHCTWIISNAWPEGDPARSLQHARDRVERLTDRVCMAAHAPQASSELAPRAGTRLAPQISQTAFETMVRRAQAAIRTGDIYQANLAQRFSGRLAADPWQLYRSLRSINPSPFACFVRLGRVTIAGGSPERLLRVQDGVADTRPIAGTRPRGATAQENLHQAVELILSEKERAEHIMLVDLERNDLGRVCDYGSVRVDELMAIEAYSHVLHIVSNVRGRLRPSADALDAFAALFPGGTITGAPKVRAMEIIDALEPVARGPYTGAVGYIGAAGAADFNIIIRSFVIADGQAHVHVGAGIVADSDPSREYAETLAKGAALQRACEQASAVEPPVLAAA